MRNFDWDNFKNNKFVVLCDTQEKAKDFMINCERHDCKWYCGKATLSDNCWVTFRRNTCYKYDKELTYDSKEHFLNGGYKIIYWNITEDETLSFEEVIKNIKPGELWVSYNKNELKTKIKMSLDGELIFEKISKVNKDDIFINETNCVDFFKAFNHMKKGGKAKSLVSDVTYEIKNNYFVMNVKNSGQETNIDIAYSEIDGEWLLLN